MSTPYRSELCHALDLTRVTSNRTLVGVSVSPCQQQKDFVEEDDDSGDEAYDSDVNELVIETFADAQLTKANTSLPALQLAHSCRVVASCQWINKKTLGTCNAGILCKGVSQHFQRAHDIKGIEWSVKIYCWWEGCFKWVQRKNFARHIRETHLGHPRVKKVDP